jgi:hypothetical protein
MASKPPVAGHFSVFSPPQGPSDPFGNGMLAVLDSVRVISIVCGVYVLIIGIVAIYYTHNWNQKLRFGSIVLYAVVAALTELEHLGDYANWRLIISTMASIWAATAMTAYVRFESPEDRRFHALHRHGTERVDPDA